MAADTSIDYQILLTDDESPTLIGFSEAMHNKCGAYSETQYVYGEALRRNKELKAEFSVFILGLGLGYIELLSIAEWLKQGKKEKFRMLTAELDSELVGNFLKWLSGEPSPFNLAYDKMYDFFKRDYPDIDVKGELLNAYHQGHWRVMGKLDSKTIPSEKFNFILYDAFSSKATPDLWSDDFLKSFFVKCADESYCAFSTYACTGILKRALAALGFTVQKRIGFSGKRDSTLAWRENFVLQNQ